MPGFRRTAAVGLVILGTLPGLSIGGPQQPDNETTPTLRVSTRLVQMDVVVRDDAGPVDG